MPLGILAFTLNSVLSGISEPLSGRGTKLIAFACALSYTRRSYGELRVRVNRAKENLIPVKEN